MKREIGEGRKWPRASCLCTVADWLRQLVFSGLCFVVVVALIGIAGGCASVNKAERVSPQPSLSVRADAALRSVTAELAAVRAELGAARIYVAKKDVELEEARRDFSQMRQTIAELSRARGELQGSYEGQRQSLDVALSEGEHLRRERQEWQRDAVEFLRLRQEKGLLEETVVSLRAKVAELEPMRDALLLSREKESADHAHLNALKDEPRTVTKEAAQEKLRAKTTPTSVPRAVKKLPAGWAENANLSGAVPVSSISAHAGAADRFRVEATGETWPVKTIVVESGDTLSTLASRHGTTVAQMRTMNNLLSDLIRVGLRLTVPSSPSE